MNIFNKFLNNQYLENKFFQLTLSLLVIIGIILAAGMLYKEVMKNKLYKENPELVKKIGQMLLIGFNGTTAEKDSEIVKYIQKYNIGGIIYFDYNFLTGTFDKNIKNPEQLQKLSADLQKYAPTKLFISADVEGGKVNRLKPKYGFDTKIPTYQLLGKTDNLQTTYKAGLKLATALSKAGINMNFTPVLDLDLKSPIITGYERAFSTDSEKVSQHASQIIKAQDKFNVISVGKHFPGHGSSLGDTHKGLVDITKSWTEQELLPFKTAINNKELDCIMIAHLLDRNIDKKYPSTLSPKFIKEMLRNNLNFNGVVISDDLNMGALKDNFSLETIIVRFINSGGDILLFSNIHEKDLDVVDDIVYIILKNIKNGTISLESINKSYDRIKKLKAKYI